MSRARTGAGRCVPSQAWSEGKGRTLGPSHAGLLANRKSLGFPLSCKMQSSQAPGWSAQCAWQQATVKGTHVCDCEINIGHQNSHCSSGHFRTLGSVQMATGSHWFAASVRLDTVPPCFRHNLPDAKVQLAHSTENVLPVVSLNAAVACGGRTRHGALVPAASPGRLAIDGKASSAPKQLGRISPLGSFPRHWARIVAISAVPGAAKAPRPVVWEEGSQVQTERERESGVLLLSQLRCILLCSYIFVESCHLQDEQNKPRALALLDARSSIFPAVLLTGTCSC